MTVKTEEIKKEVTETVTKYVASDGTEFRSESLCREYEETLPCIFKTRLKDCSVNIDKDDMYKKGLDCLLDDGCSRTDYTKFTPKTDEDLNNLIGYLKSTKTFLGKNTDWNVVRLGLDELKVGETYLYIQIDECEYSYITSLEKIKSVLTSGWNFLMEDEKKEEKKGE